MTSLALLLFLGTKLWDPKRKRHFIGRVLVIGLWACVDVVPRHLILKGFVGLTIGRLKLQEASAFIFHCPKLFQSITKNDQVTCIAISCLVYYITWSNRFGDQLMQNKMLFSGVCEFHGLLYSDKSVNFLLSVPHWKQQQAITSSVPPQKTWAA